MSFEIHPGEPFPLGATPDADGVNFAVWSSVADRVEVCFFGPEGEVRRALPGRTEGVDGGSVHHGYVPGARPGWHYGFRVHGRWEPAAGHLANPAKLLVDPYARAVAGGATWGDALLAHDAADPAAPSRLDSAPHVPRAVVVHPGGAGRGEPPGGGPPRTPLAETLIYETHVKGLTARHPRLPPELRGTYRGLAHPAVVEHLLSLGVTAVELLPVQHHLSRRFLVARGLVNYWGYDPLAFGAPHVGYAAAGADPAAEFRAMVGALHAAGLEVLLDVVYNHTVEGGPGGPSLSLRGFDAAAYYRQGVDFTGTGGSLDARHPAVVRLIVETLRRWVVEHGVDGFRFDLATTLARGDAGYRRDAPLFAALAAEPVLAGAKLIAEPWDAAPGGYQVGGFPPPFAEWNGRYRDTVRDVWRGAGGRLPDLARRLTGSADLYAARGPLASVNFVTCHDGFTLADLVAYERKHNLANGEGNRDGSNDNRSTNHGHEGPTGDPAILGRRRRSRRNLAATLLLSHGVPMLLGGDEIGRTQGGNNNAYAQDNETSWYDWEAADEDFLAFVRRLAALRRAHPVFRLADHTAIAAAVRWFTPGGAEKRPADWHREAARAVAMLLDGRGVGDAAFLLLLNANPEALEFRLPAAEGLPGGWVRAIDTALEEGFVADGAEVGQATEVAARSLVLLRAVRPPAPA